MNLPINEKMREFIDEKVTSGEYASPEDVLQAALASLQLHDSYGDFAPGELDELLAEGRRSIEQHGVTPAQDVFARLRKQDRGAGNS
jgi:Arc/MetJ-type ribon-helix-helix transcriptional regulator